MQFVIFLQSTTGSSSVMFEKFADAYLAPHEPLHAPLRSRH